MHVFETAERSTDDTDINHHDKKQDAIKEVDDSDFGGWVEKYSWFKSVNKWNGETYANHDDEEIYRNEKR